MSERECKKCKITKPLTSFNVRTGLKLDRAYFCKECSYQQEKDWLNRNLEHNRQYRRNYYQLHKEEIRERHKKYMQTYLSNPEEKIKNKARNTVSRAIKGGKLERLPCQKCGELKVQAHHEDYSKPLEVVWLCTIHHKEIHKNI